MARAASVSVQSISVSEAQLRILERVRPLGAERVPIVASLGRVLIDPIVARVDLPPWDNSAMDGYAVRVADVVEGSALPVSLDIPAGAPVGQTLPSGTVGRIMTGAPVPAGADAVVPVEESIAPAGRAVFAAPGEVVRFAARPERGANIRSRGEDVRRGSVAVPAGAACAGPQIAMAASAGHAFLSVVRRPRVAVVSTGDELVDVGEAGGVDRIVNGNAYGIAAQISEAGGEPTLLPIVPDRPEATRAAIASALTTDAAVTIGGVSAGARDYVRDALAEAGVEVVFWKVALRPGGPMAFGTTADGRPVFALPGNPVSAQVTFELFVRPALLRMGGRARCFRRPIRARLAEAVRTGPEKAYFLRVRLSGDGDGWSVSTTGPQGSAILSGLVAADGLLAVPRGVTGLPVGAAVDVLPIGDRAFMEEEPMGEIPKGERPKGAESS